MYKLEGRTALVTGAGGGIGRAIAVRLAQEGCDIVVFDVSETSATETAALIQQVGRAAHVTVGSVANRRDVSSATAAAIEKFGRIDILVNNAGILRTAKFLDTTDQDWRDVFSVNVDGMFNFCQAVLPRMLERRTGAIVNMSSWTGKKGVPNHAAYSASKFAVIGLTQSMASEMAEHGIRVNAVCPGLIVDTHMRVQAEALNKIQGMADADSRAKTMIPLRRVGYPDDIARVVAFLASDEAAYMTGQAINVTGGLWMS